MIPQFIKLTHFNETDIEKWSNYMEYSEYVYAQEGIVYINPNKIISIKPFYDTWTTKQHFDDPNRLLPCSRVILSSGEVYLTKMTIEDIYAEIYKTQTKK